MQIDRRFQDLTGIDLPIVLAPMAGPGASELAIAVAEAGGLGSLPCALMDDDRVRAEFGIIRQRTAKPINLNFFCHKPARFDAAREAGWRQALAPYYDEFGLDPGQGAELGPQELSTPSAARWSRSCGPRSSASISGCRKLRCWRG